MKSRCVMCLEPGEICHIVQLAVSQKKLLGYIDGQLLHASRYRQSVWQLRRVGRAWRGDAAEACV